jgi:hypothetical protein
MYTKMAILCTYVVAMLSSRLTYIDLVQIWLKGGFLLNQRTHFNNAVGN